MSKKFGFLKSVAAPEQAEGTPRKRKQTASAEAGATRRGRPRGKRSNPDFEQVTIYIRRKTHKDAKVELLKGEKRQEFSELVEDLLAKWLKK